MHELCAELLSVIALVLALALAPILHAQCVSSVNVMTAVRVHVGMTSGVK